MKPGLTTAEDLVRLEHKVDLLLDLVCSVHWNAFGTIPDFEPFKSGRKCPVCQQETKFYISMADGMIHRSCGCKSGLVPMTMEEANEVRQAPVKQEVINVVQSDDDGSAG